MIVLLELSCDVTVSSATETRADGYAVCFHGIYGTVLTTSTVPSQAKILCSHISRETEKKKKEKKTKQACMIVIFHEW